MDDKNDDAPLPFGAVLARVRGEQGYKTPYAFFRSRGGQKGLGLTFANYLRLEKGKGLPKGWRLKRLLESLELMPHSEKGRELLRAYLLSVLGSEELLQDLLGAAGGGDLTPSGWQMAKSAAQEALSKTKIQLELPQYQAIAADPTAYACHVVVCNTEGWSEPKDLAKTIGRPVAEVLKALKGLEKAGLVKREGTRARSTLEKNYVVPPAPTPAMSAVYAKLQDYRRRWKDENATAVHTPYIVLRANKEKLKRYFDNLTEVVNMSAIYGDIKPGPDTDMYLVEGRIHRLFTR